MSDSETRVIQRVTVTVKRFRKFRARVQWRAAELGITMVGLARRLEVTPRRLHRILSAKAIDIRTLERLTRALEWEGPEWDRALPSSPARQIKARMVAGGDRLAKKFLDQENTKS